MKRPFGERYFEGQFHTFLSRKKLGVGGLINYDCRAHSGRGFQRRATIERVGHVCYLKVLTRNRSEIGNYSARTVLHYGAAANSDQRRRAGRPESRCGRPKFVKKPRASYITG